MIGHRTPSPGPWRIGEEHETKAEIEAQTTPGTWAKVMVAVGPGAGANARLAAAAPELLDLCRRLIDPDRALDKDAVFDDASEALAIIRRIGNL